MVMIAVWFHAVSGWGAPDPDLGLTGTASPSPVSVGELLTVQLTVTNGGGAAASGVTLLDTISSNATFFSVTPSQGSYTQTNGTVTCSLGSLGVGATATVKIMLTPGPFGTLTNSVNVSENETDSNPADNALVQTVLVMPLTFYPGPNLNVARSWHTATLLPDGRVLIAGGNTGWGGNPLASAEIYDPATKTFSLTGNMQVARNSHVAALLADGTVLVAGGFNSGISAELFNPTNGTFTSVSNLNNWHVSGTATLLQDGRVLVEGNSYNYPYNPAEIYVPGLHAFTNISGTLDSANRRMSFRLADGRILLPGGTIGSGFDSSTGSEYYDPAQNQFVATAPLQYPRSIYGGVQLLDGRILIAGGNGSGQTAEFFDTNSMTYTAATNLMRSPHWFCTANRLPDGSVLVAGFGQQTDLFNPTNNSFSRAPDMLVGRLYYTATTLRDGSVLIVGGQAANNQIGPALATTEIYDPARTKPPPAVSITNATTLEGDVGTTNLVFNLTLSSAMGVPVSVDFATADGSAAAGSDYVATNGTVVFAPGATNQTVVVAVIGNRNYEPDKTFSVTLANPTNVAIDAASGTGTILNDDPIPTVTVAPASILKPNVRTTNFVINVFLSASSYQTIWVDYATGDGSGLAGTDYTATNGLLTFNPGVTNQTITVPVIGNTLYEPNKIFYVTLSNPTNALINPPGAETIVSLNGQPGYLDHFNFSPIVSPQDTKVPFALTVTACDALNNVVTNFNGFVALTGSVTSTPSYWFDFEEGDFSQWTPLNLSSSPGPYQIVPFDVPGLGYTSLAFRIAANSGPADGITRPVTLQAGVIYQISADIASENEGGGINGDPGTAHLLVGSQEIGTFSFGVFGQIGSQVFHTNLAAVFQAPTNGDYQLSVRFDRGYLESGVWNYADNVRVSAPPLTPLWLAYFTNGIWTGNLTVGASATNLVLHVDDENGDFGNAAPFDVVNFADVALRTSITPSSPRVGTNLIYTLLVTNLGPGLGTGLVVTNLLPPNQTFLSATSTVGTCSFLSGVVRCAIGTLSADQTATVTITTEPFLPGTVTNFAGLASVSVDPNLTNNSSQTAFTVKPPLLYISGTTVVERSYTTTNAVFNVFVGGPYVQTIQVDYATANGTATAGLDYVAASGHLTFTSPVTNLTVAVTVSNDFVHESAETFSLNLSNPTNAELANGGTATATILNTDPVPNLHHFDFSAIASPQQGSVSFGVTITARDVNDVLLTGYSSTLSLTATNASGNPVPVSPLSVSMVNGQWSGNITVPSWAFSGVRILATDSDGLSSASGAFDVIPPTVYLINLAASDLAYSATSRLLYASITNGGTLTPIDPFSGTVGTPVSVTNLSGRLCASDGGQYIFAALNGPTNHICQFDVNSQLVVNAWTLDGNYVDDMSPVLGSPAAVAVSRYVANRSPRFAGVAIYDNGVARPNIAGGFLGANVIEPSRSPDTIYGYDNESSPAGSQVMHVDASGITTIGGWGGPQGFGVDISCRANLIFATTGQIFDPTRSLQIGTFNNTPVSDDAASGRYYLVSAGAVVAYDQNTLLPVGATALPGVTGAAGSFLRWGTNGFALRVNSTKIALVRTPLISGGAPADLQLSATLPPLPLGPSNAFSYTLTVSNAGPNTAQNVVLTQTLPANSTFLSATNSAGTNTVTGGGLVCLLQAIPAGNLATVTVRLQTLKPGLLAAVASVTSDSLDPNLTNNGLHLEMPVAQPLAHDTVTELTLPTSDLVWDKISGRIFASAPNADWLLGNRIIVLDPLSGNYDPRVPTALDPGKLAVSDDGQYLYAGINSDTSIQRINLALRTADLKFPTGYGGVADMAVLPGSPQTVAVTAHTTFVVYDSGVPRANVVGPGAYNFDYYLAATDTNTLAYEAMTDGLLRIGIDSSGATASGLGLIRTYDNQIHFDAGRLYTAGGEVIDPLADVVITNLSYSGLVRPDSGAGKIFYLTTSGSTGTLHAVNVSNFVETGAVTINNLSGTPTSLITWGTDGLAFRTTGNQVFLIRTLLADDRNNDGLPDSWQLQYFGSLNAPGAGPNDNPAGDGFTNLQKYRAGLNPLVFYPLEFTQAGPLSSGGFQLTVLGNPGSNYVLEASSDLVSWTGLLKFVCTNIPTVLSDPAATNLPWRFYRIAPVSAVPGPLLRFASPVLAGTNRLSLALDGIPGFNYAVQTSSNLVNWTTLTNFYGNSATMYFQDAPAAFTSRFYRATAQ